MADGSRLDDVNIQRLDAHALVNPVIIIHAPRGTGATTLIGSLLSSLPSVDGAVVLTDRAVTSYMSGAVPPQLVLNKPADKVLKQLIGMQQHHMRNFPTEPLSRIALALDDVMYSPKLLKSEDFQRDVKIAQEVNITVIISTADVALLPNNVYTFGTHVFGTKCVSSDEPKLLQKRMFVMFEDASELIDMLALCRPYEFLVGILRPPVQGIRSIETLTRTYIAKKEIPAVRMATPMVEKLSLLLEKV